MPCAFVTAVRVPICAVLVAVTLTPGSTAPLESVTSPWMVPVDPAPPWARARAGRSKTASARSERLRFLTIYLLDGARHALGWWPPAPRDRAIPDVDWTKRKDYLLFGASGIPEAPDVVKSCELKCLNTTWSIRGTQDADCWIHRFVRANRRRVALIERGCEP